MYCITLHFSFLIGLLGDFSESESTLRWVVLKRRWLVILVSGVVLVYFFFLREEDVLCMCVVRIPI